MFGGLTDEQVQLVRYALSNSTKFRVFPEIVETVLFAVFTVLICVSTGVLISKGLRHWPNRVMLALTLFMCSGSTLEWASDIKSMWDDLNILLPGLLTPAGQVGGDINSALNALNGSWAFTSDVFSQINILLSDAVVLWRACVVWHWHKGVVSATALILTCLLGANVACLVSAFGTDFPSAPKSLLPVSNDFADISATVFSVSTFANVCATSMVACKAWIHRRDIRRYVQNRTAKSTVENILTLLVESGIVYSICMVALMLTEFSSIPSLQFGPFFYYWDVIMNQVSGMYVTLVIVLVALQKTHCEHQFSFVDKGPDATPPFSIRVPQSQTSAGISAPGTHASLQLGPSEDVPDEGGSDTSPGVFTPQEKEHVGE